MKRPYIICHMMASVDGRIDCAMTEKLPGVAQYYDTLNQLNAPTNLSGRVTAQLEMAQPGVFHAENSPAHGKEGFFKPFDAVGYTVVVDTKGTLLWEDQIGADEPLLVITSEQVTDAYLTYLEQRRISWIACGKERIDLARACEILASEFGVQRMAIVGGPHINAAFLAAGLLDEVSVLIGSGIDGRGGMEAVFDGLPMQQEPIQLKLTHVQQYGEDAVWLRYTVR